MTYEPPLQTGAVAELVSHQLQLDPPLTERRICEILRRTPTLRPPVLAGRRQWAPEHVAMLIGLLRARARSA